MSAVTSANLTVSLPDTCLPSGNLAGFCVLALLCCLCLFGLLLAAGTSMLVAGLVAWLAGGPLAILPLLACAPVSAAQIAAC